MLFPRILKVHALMQSVRLPHRSCWGLFVLVVIAIAMMGCQSAPISTVATGTQSVHPVVAQKGQLHREVWKKIYDFYYDPEFNGIDWVKSGRDTNDLLESATDVESVYQVLQAMVNTLEDRHTYVLSPAECAEMNHFEHVGIGLTTSVHRSVDDVNIVLRVAPGSPAEEAGIEPGWLLLNGSEVLDLAMQCGDSARYRFLDNGQQVRELDLVAAVIPNTSDEREVRWLHSGVLYARFDSFEAGVSDWLRDQLRQHAALKGLVIDLRWNPGGLKSELDRLFELFLPQTSDLGIVITRQTRLLHEYTRSSYDEPSNDVPLVILVSPYSASSSEIFSAVLQYHQRAIIVGTGTTSGEVLFSPGWQLPEGGLLKIAARDYLTPTGDRLHGKGVEPDILADQSSFFELRRGVDPTLEAALIALNPFDN